MQLLVSQRGLTCGPLLMRCFSAGPVYTPLQPASRTGEQMEGWGIGDIPLHGRVAQPAELGKKAHILNKARGITDIALLDEGPSYIFLASADSNVSFVSATTSSTC